MTTKVSSSNDFLNQAFIAESVDDHLKKIETIRESVLEYSDKSFQFNEPDDNSLLPNTSDTTYKSGIDWEKHLKADEERERRWNEPSFPPHSGRPYYNPMRRDLERMFNPTVGDEINTPYGKKYPKPKEIRDDFNIHWREEAKLKKLVPMKDPYYVPLKQKTYLSRIHYPEIWNYNPDYNLEVQSEGDIDWDDVKKQKDVWKKNKAKFDYSDKARKKREIIQKKERITTQIAVIAIACIVVIAAVFIIHKIHKCVKNLLNIIS